MVYFYDRLDHILWRIMEGIWNFVLEKPVSIQSMVSRLEKPLSAQGIVTVVEPQRKT